MSGQHNKDIIHLDCTLRDGGYYNNWEFDENLINDYLKAMKDAKVDVVEIGFRSLNNENYKGPTAYSKDEFINSLKIPKSIKIAVMINASELIQNKKFSKKNLYNLIPHKNKNTKVKIIRIACHHHEFPIICKFSNLIKDLGYILILNLMQSSELTEKILENFLKLLKKSKIDVFYLADSLGSLDEFQLNNILKKIKNKKLNLPIGFHAHDNLTLAHRNSVFAIKSGVKWIDSTINGMGRGPGNARTELLIPALSDIKKKKVSVVSLEKLIFKYFLKLKEKYHWGTNYYYYKAAINKIHPTFIQMMERDKRYTPEDKLRILNKLSKSKNTINFSHTLFEENLKKNDVVNKQNISDFNKLKSIFKKYKKKEILLIGAGPSTAKHKKQIENYIKLKKIPVFMLNTQKIFNKDIINFIIACHPLRIIADKKSYEKLNTLLITPLDQINYKEIARYKIKNKIINIPMSVKSQTLRFKKGSSYIPKLFSSAYALTIFSALKVKKINLIGFDGYEQSELNEENNYIFSEFKNKFNKIVIKSLTPTKYNIDQSSLYFY